MTIFDRIIAGQIPASFAHQDPICVVFMDINPITQGHVLVVPRRSVATLAELDEPTRQHLWAVVQRIGMAQQQGLGSHAQHLLVNDGRAASQSVPHVHIHVIPRYAHDTLRTISRMIWHVSTLTLPRRETAARRFALDQAAQKISAALQI
jgi:histidine triad (HIT) family protein